MTHMGFSLKASLCDLEVPHLLAGIPPTQCVYRGEGETVGVGTITFGLPGKLDQLCNSSKHVAFSVPWLGQVQGQSLE